MTRRFPLALVLLALACAGCTFERRPASGSAGSSADSSVQRPAEDPTGLGIPAAETLAEARAFFRDLQDLRRGGRLAEIRDRIHPGASLFLAGRALSPDAPASTLEPLLAPELPAEGASGVATSVTPLESGVLVVVRYPAAPPDRAAAVETLLLARGSAGWSVRFLQRTRRAR